MKTILSICGSSLLLPETADLPTVVKMLKGAKLVREETIYGTHPETGADSYREEHGFLRKQVIQQRAETIRVEVMDDDEVFTPKQFEAAREAAEKSKQVNLSKAA